MIDELVRLIVERLKIDEATARKGVGAVMALIQETAKPQDVRALFTKLEGSRDLARRFSRGGPRGLMGLLVGLFVMVLGIFFGRRVKSAAQYLGRFAGTGVGLDDIKAMLPVVLEFAREKVGPEIMARIVDRVPGLKGLIDQA